MKIQTSVLDTISSIQTNETSNKKRIILYTGKGGVGKSSLAAISAVHIANTGKKVLIMSTDLAHSLSDSFDMKLDKEPTKINDNLYGMEIDTVYESEKGWKHVKSYFKELLTIKGNGGIEVEELLVFPGLEELFSMFKILEIYEQNVYDVILVDCAPTGETLSLLKYPEKLSGFLEKVLPIKRKGVQIVGPAVETIMKIPMPKDNVFDDIEYVMEKMKRLQELMLNKEVVSLRIVTTPEQIVIREAKRNFTYLHLYHYNVDAIFVNRIYPAKAMDGYFNKWIQMQEKGLKEIKESFFEIPKFYLELQKDEIRTLPVLKNIAKQLFFDKNITNVLCQQRNYELEKKENSIVLKIMLPFAKKEDLSLRQTQDELILGIKNEERRFSLPKEAKNMEISTAKYEDGFLNITFT